MELYDFQKRAKDQIQDQFAKVNRVICCAPTGSGKTVISSSVLENSLAKGKRVCVVVHRIEILKQFYRTFHNFGIKLINFVVSDVTRRHLTEEGFQGFFDKGLKQVNLCMVETFHRRYGRHYHELGVDFFILDEIHWGSYRKLCRESNKSFILGFTATPKATSKTEPLSYYFDELVVPVTIKELIKKGFLVRGRTFSIDYDFSRLKKRMGEFTEASLYNEFKKPKLFKGVVESYKKHALGLRAICYNVNVQHSKEVCQEFQNNGISAIHVDGTTPAEERAEIFKAYERGEADVLCNVGVATTGYDSPNTRCIIENFSTMQLTKHHQALGRGARPITNPIARKKDEFIILDMGRNYLRHGLYGDDIDWHSIFHNPDLSENDKENQKRVECKNCEAVIKAKSIKCPYCDHERTAKEVSESLQQFMTLKEIRDVKRDQLPDYLRKNFKDMSDEELKQYQLYMGYKPQWFWVIRNKLGRK